MRKQLAMTALSLSLMTGLVACTALEQADSQQPGPRVTARGSAEGRLPPIADAQELEDAIVSCGECVEESFPIVLRFRTDAFTGLHSEVGSQHESDGDRVDRASAECNNKFEIDTRLSVFQSEHPLSAEASAMLAREFVDCVGAVSDQARGLIMAAAPESYEATHEVMARLGTQQMEPAALVSISGCYDDLSGPAYVFADGHPWFVPES